MKYIDYDKEMKNELSEMIDHIEFHKFKGAGVTVCCLTLKNGTAVTGEAANTDINIKQGTKKTRAHNRAYKKVNELHIFKIRQHLLDLKESEYQQELKTTDTEMLKEIANADSQYD